MIIDSLEVTGPGKEDGDVIDFAITIQKLKNEGFTNRAIGQLLGRSESFVWNMLQLLVLDDEYKKMLKDGRLTLSAAWLLARFNNQDQGQWIERARTLPLVDFLAQIREHNHGLVQDICGDFVNPDSVEPSI